MSVRTGMPVATGMLVTVAWLLAGCSMSSMNPINWWHRQEGGKIAEERPAPPGADQPYPNISTVPARPGPVDQEALNKLTASLVADRTNAQHAAQSAPLADPSSPTASPGLFGVGTAPPPPPSTTTTSPTADTGSPGTPVASASLPAVTAPAAPPSPAPRKAVQSTPLDALPDQTTAPTASGPTGSGPRASGVTASGPATYASPTSGPATSAPTASGPTVAARNGPLSGPPEAATPSASPAVTSAANVPVTGPQPALPAGPPPRPAAAGASPAVPVLAAPMPAPSAGTSATIVFLDQAFNLSPAATDEVKSFAAKRGSSTISVIGYGDSTSSDPDAQSAALNLGLSRAQSIVDALKADGVPGNAIRVSAEASGRGAALQLLQ